MSPTVASRPPKPEQLSLLPLLSEGPSSTRVPPRAPVPTWLESVAIILAVMAFGFLWVGLEGRWGDLAGQPGALGKGARVELSSGAPLAPVSGRLPSRAEATDPHGLNALADRARLLADRWIQRAPRGNAPS